MIRGYFDASIRQRRFEKCRKDFVDVDKEFESWREKQEMKKRKSHKEGDE